MIFMKSINVNALLCLLTFLCAAVYAQDGGPCANCPFIGNNEVLVACSQYWRDIVNRCASTPECSRYGIRDSLIDSCTNTPLPLPSGTGSSTITAIFDSTTTAAPGTGTSSVNTTSSYSSRITRSRTKSSNRTSTTIYNPGPTQTGSSTTDLAPLFTDQPTATTSSSTGTFSQALNGAGANVPGWWVEGAALVVGGVFAL